MGGKTESAMVIGILFDDAGQDRRKFVEAWAKGIRENSLKAGLDIDSPDFVLLTVSLDGCGAKAIYRTVGDIPLVNVPCSCGNPSHWLIKYVEEQ